MNKRQLPPNASVANEDTEGRLVAPAASRNTQAICDLLQLVAPPSGTALELASGTGQHVARFARCLPDLRWQPSEIDPQRRASIDAYTAALPNVSTAVELNATALGWHRDFGKKDLIILINLLHLISRPETEALIAEAARSLNVAGRFVLYGPFMRSGELTSDGDKRFHEALTQQDPEIGYKDDSEILELLRADGLKLIQITEMPANNLAFVVEKPDI